LPKLGGQSPIFDRFFHNIVITAPFVIFLSGQLALDFVMHCADIERCIRVIGELTFWVHIRTLAPTSAWSAPTIA
jgi:hypothetical protein